MSDESDESEYEYNYSSDSSDSFDSSGYDSNPKPPTKPPTGAYYDIGTRVQALTLLEAGVPIPHITALTTIKKTGIYRLWQTAVQRGYNLDICKKILIKYVGDAPRSGRPPTSQVIVGLIIYT